MEGKSTRRSARPRVVPRHTTVKYGNLSCPTHACDDVLYFDVASHSWNYSRAKLRMIALNKLVSAKAWQHDACEDYNFSVQSHVVSLYFIDSVLVYAPIPSIVGREVPESRRGHRAAEGGN